MAKQTIVIEFAKGFVASRSLRFVNMVFTRAKHGVYES